MMEGEMSTWPKHPDGTNKTMGEMTPEERREQTMLSCERLRKKFEAALTKIADMDVDYPASMKAVARAALAKSKQSP